MRTVKRETLGIHTAMRVARVLLLNAIPMRIAPAVKARFALIINAMQRDAKAILSVKRETLGIHTAMRMANVILLNAFLTRIAV